MYRTIAATARAITACLAMIVGVSAAEAHDDYVVYYQGGADAPLQYVVHYADLNLSSVDGVTALYGRLRRAAELVCPLERTEISLRGRQDACMAKAIGAAIATVNSPLLTQYHRLRSKGDRVGLALLARVQ